MGNDGGSIPKRRELVKNAARAPTTSELKATALESLSHAWTHCALSGSPLDRDAVVSDCRGRLYNYEVILKGLMPSDTAAEDRVADVTASSLGIKSLRDVSKLKFSKNGDKWVCPVSMKELGPAVRSVYLVPCGHVFAEVAITEVQEKACLSCSEPFDSANVIPILPVSEQDVARLDTRIEDLRSKGLTHTLKKDKSEKKKKRKADEASAGDGTNGKDKKVTGDAAAPKKDGDARINGINNPLAASLTARVLAEQDERNKRRKLVTDASLRRGEVTKG